MRISLYIALFTGLLMVVIKLLTWRRRPETRPCSWFGHDKRYVAIKTYNVVALNDPTSDGKPLTCGHKHKIGDKGIYSARWACKRCPVLGEDCLGNDQDWTIRQEQLVPDVKKWANWSQNPPPANNDAAREKLKEIQKRLGPPPPAEDQPRLSDFLTPQEKIDRTLLAHDVAAPDPVVVKTELVKAKNYCQTCGWNHDGPCNPTPKSVDGCPVCDTLSDDKKLRHCHQCGAQHTGPCVPGGIS